MNKTFAAIEKLKDVEIELHRLKNALSMTSRAFEEQCEKKRWVGLTNEQRAEIASSVKFSQFESAHEFAYKVQLATEDKLKELNT